MKGKKHGKWMDWYKNGEPRMVTSYNMDVYDGECGWFYPNGNKKKVTIYKNGVFMKKMEWNEDGTEKSGGF